MVNQFLCVSIRSIKKAEITDKTLAKTNKQPKPKEEELVSVSVPNSQLMTRCIGCSTAGACGWLQCQHSCMRKPLVFPIPIVKGKKICIKMFLKIQIHWVIKYKCNIRILFFKYVIEILLHPLPPMSGL